jgi:hypothetical protein
MGSSSTPRPSRRVFLKVAISGWRVRFLNWVEPSSGEIGEAVAPCDVAFEGGYVFCVEVKNDGDGDDYFIVRRVWGKRDGGKKLRNAPFLLSLEFLALILFRS